MPSYGYHLHRIMPHYSRFKQRPTAQTLNAPDLKYHNGKKSASSLYTHRQNKRLRPIGINKQDDLRNRVDENTCKTGSFTYDSAIPPSPPHSKNEKITTGSHYRKVHKIKSKKRYLILRTKNFLLEYWQTLRFLAAVSLSRPILQQSSVYMYIHIGGGWTRNVN
jgi:hypothetical protein